MQLQDYLKELTFWKHHKVVWLTTTGSTNDDLKEIWRKPQFFHCLEVADQQTNGKGQYERKWASKNDKQALMFSFSAEVKEYEFPISMIAGVALAATLQKVGLSPEKYWLKWPNDIWACQKKLAGILTESTCFTNGFRCVIGIGINFKPLGEKGINSISLEELGLKISHEDFLKIFCKSWNDIFSKSAKEQCKYWQSYADGFRQITHLVKTGNEQPFLALPQNITSDGSLIVKTANGTEKEIISATLIPIF